MDQGNGGHIHGVQLGDELVLGSIPHFSLANLTALAARFHDGLHPHDVFIFTNEGESSRPTECRLNQSGKLRRGKRVSQVVARKSRDGRRFRPVLTSSQWM